MAISSELEQLLASWIPRQSWFPKLAADFGTDPDITPMSVARAFTFTAEELGGFSGLVTVISVGDGPTLRRLNIPLSLRGTEDIHLRHALIGTVDDLALGRVFVYDGAADPVFVNLLADAITKRMVFDGGQLSTESLRHSRERGSLPPARGSGTSPGSGTASSASGGAASVHAASAGSVDSPTEAIPPRPSSVPGSGQAPGSAEDPQPAEAGARLTVEIRPIEVADSGANKSTVVIHDEDEPVELSFFRVLENGMPSSLTIPVLLTEAGSRSVPEVIGWSSGRWYDMFEVTEMEAPMALLSHTDVEAEPAWREAVDIVCAVDSGSIGGYNAQAAEMGRRIGELHADMAAEFGIVEGRGAPTKEFVDKWVERVEWALGRAPLALDGLVPELKQHKAELRSLETIGQLQKIHGELTLDHVVSSPSDGYTVVKFTDASNSEPKPVALDLVALLRSVDYAAGYARLQRTDALGGEDGGLVVNGFGDTPTALRSIYDSPEYLWASQVQNSLLSGYSRARGESIGLNDPVLRAALIDRLLVEVVTELRNRPNWLSVPLATLTLILKGKPARSSEDPTEAELSVPADDAGSETGSTSGTAAVAGAAGVVGVAGAAAAASAPDGDDRTVQDAAAAADEEATEAHVEAADENATEADVEAADENATDTSARGDGQDVLVDAVSAEAVVAQDESPAELTPEDGGFVEPSVEAPTDEPATRDGETTSERGTTVTRTPFIAESAPAQTSSESPTSHGAASADTDVADPAEAVRITGGASTAEAYVDGVTAEMVERVDDGVPEADLGVHDQAEPDLEAPETEAEPQSRPAETTSNEPELSEADDYSAATAAMRESAPPIIEESRPVGGQRLPDAPPMPAEPPAPAPESLPDAPEVGGVIGAPNEDAIDDEEETEFVPSRVPATFAARGATSADADSSGRSPHERHKHEADPPSDTSPKTHKKKGKNKH